MTYTLILITPSNVFVSGATVMSFDFLHRPEMASSPTQSLSDVIENQKGRFEKSNSRIPISVKFLARFQEIWVCL